MAQEQVGKLFQTLAIRSLHLVMGVEESTIPELKRLLALSPGYSVHDVEVAISSFFDTWRSNPRFSTHLLDLLAKRRLAGLCEDVLRCMSKGRLEISVFECSAVISAYEKDGNWKLALRFLQAMRQLCNPNMACCLADFK